MANGHVEIHDFPSSVDDLTSRTDCKSTSDTDGMTETVEYRLMMAYAQRRRPKKEPSTPGSPDALNVVSDSNGTSSPQTPANAEKEAPVEKKKKKKLLKRLSSLLTCLKPQIVEDVPPKTPERPNDKDDRCGDFHSDVVEEDKFDEIASRLTEIADEIPFTPPEEETDAPDDDVEKVIGLLLRETGDRLNERELKDASIATELFWDYSFFETLIKTLLRRMGLWTSNPDSPGPQPSPKTQIAVTCEVTSRLSAVDTLPMNRLLGYGATYLQNHFSSWATENGGYEAAFVESDDEDVQ